MEQQSYIPVPPPPLPEFYAAKRRKSKSKSTSASTIEVDEETIVIKEAVTSVDGTYDGRPGLGSIPHKPMTTIPPPSNTDDVPPLAIYHICRICLRPRSPRYHREHPIPIDGVPPPPGICRRCRVTSAEETKKVSEVEFVSESAPIKIGCITPFLPDDDIVSNEEMKRMRVEKYLDERSAAQSVSRSKEARRKDIVFRHVKVVDELTDDGSEEEEVLEEVVEEVTTPRKKKVVFTSRNTPEKANEAVMPEQPRASRKDTTSMQVQATNNPPSVASRQAKSEALRKLDSAKASISTQASSSTTRSSSRSTARASARVTTDLQPQYAESDIRNIARDEIDRYAREALEPRQRHAEIRRIAREEVEHYRQAERKLEAHPEAYARGRLVPVERRIDVERDTAEPTPWTKPPAEDAATVKVSGKARSEVERRDSVYEPATKPTNQRQDSMSDSWGPRWRREISVERHRRRESIPEGDSGNTDAFIDNPRKPKAADRERRSQASVKLHEVYDTVSESDPPRWSSKAAPCVFDVTRNQPQDRHSVIEVSEEIDLPPRSRAASYRRPEDQSSAPVRSEPPVPDRVRELRATYQREEGPPANSQTSKQAQSTEWDMHSEATKRTSQHYVRDDAAVRTVGSRSSKQQTIPRSTAMPQGAAEPSQPAPTEGSRRGSVHSRVEIRSEQGSDKTRWPREQSIREEARDSIAPSSKSLPYPEHDAMPDRPARPSHEERKQASIAKGSKHRSSTQRPNSEYIYVERTVQPADRPRGSRPFDDRPPREQLVAEETWVVRRRPEADEPPRRRRREHHQRDIRESEESTHVKFNSKVEISPTPPGSDASSSEFRSFHSIGPAAGRQIDGIEDSRPGGVYVAEVERRGRTRSRDSRTRHFHERETVYETEDGRQTVIPKSKHGKKNSHRDAAWITGACPLLRALSESPSREADIPSSQYSKSDGRGPYREPEKVTGSMENEDGSPRSRAAWQDFVASTHSSIGEAARVRW